MIRENLKKMESFITKLSDENIEEFTDYSEGYVDGFVAGANLNKKEVVA